MSLIIILAALLVERLAIFMHPWRAYHGFERYTRKLSAFFNQKWYFTLPLSLIPALILIYGLHTYLAGLSFGWPAWVFDFMVLLYCLGNTQLRPRAQECYEQMALGNLEQARALLLENFDVIEVQDITPAVLVRAFYRASLQRVFSILFWFTVLGPVGAMLYRLNHKLAVDTMQENSPMRLATERIALLMDWIPVRLLALTFCLAGNFMSVFRQWRSTFYLKLHETCAVLYHCGYAAIYTDPATGQEEERTTILLQLDDTYALLYRSLLIWLVALALILLF